MEMRWVKTLNGYIYLYLYFRVNSRAVDSLVCTKDDRSYFWKELKYNSRAEEASSTLTVYCYECNFL